MLNLTGIIGWIDWETQCPLSISTAPSRFKAASSLWAVRNDADEARCGQITRIDIDEAVQFMPDSKRTATYVSGHRQREHVFDKPVTHRDRDPDRVSSQPDTARGMSVDIRANHSTCRTEYTEPRGESHWTRGTWNSLALASVSC